MPQTSGSSPHGVPPQVPHDYVTLYPGFKIAAIFVLEDFYAKPQIYIITSDFLIKLCLDRKGWDHIESTKYRFVICSVNHALVRESKSS